MDFVVLEFETIPNEKTPFALSLIVVKNGVTTQRIYRLFRSLDYYNLFIHDVTDVQSSFDVAFPEVWVAIQPYIAGHHIVSHNVNFQLRILRKLLDSFYLPCPTFDFTCIQKITDADKIDHVHALDAAESTVTRTLKAIELYSVDNVVDLNRHLGIKHGKVNKFGIKNVRTTRDSYIDIRKIKPQVERFDLLHSFYDRTIVFTGKLKAMTRRKAIQKVINLGGYSTNSVTKETDYLVVGEINKRSPKQIRAEELGVKNITEKDFVKKIGT